MKEKKDMEKILNPIKETKLDVQQHRDNLHSRLSLISLDAESVKSEL